MAGFWRSKFFGLRYGAAFGALSPPAPDPTIGVPVLSLAVAANFYPISLNTPLPPDWQAGVTSVHFQATTVADADAGWLSPSIDDIHLITNAESTAGAWTVPGLSGIVSPAVTVFRARAEQGSAFGAWSNELIHGDVAAPNLTSSVTPTARPELVDSIVYIATFDEKVTITSFGGADAALLVAENASVPATSFNIRRLDGATLDYENKTGYTFTISFKDRANNAATSASITAAVQDVDEIPTLTTGFFTDKTGATASTVYSPPETYTVAGLATGISVPITITGGEYRKNGGSWVSTAGTVTNGNTVEVRGTSSAVDGGVVNVVLTIGGGSDTFTITNINTFDPASLFGPSDNGFFHDISDLTTLWSDTARTVQAVVDGPVKRITDKSGKGNDHIWQSGNTLTLRQTGAFYYLEAPAANGVTSIPTLALNQPWERITGLRQTDWNAFDRVYGTVSGEGVVRQEGSSPGIMVNDGTSTAAVSPALNTDHVISEVHNNTSSQIQLDNGTPATGASGATNGVGHVLFNRGAGDRAVGGWFWGGICITRTLTSGERGSMRTWCAAKYGGSL